MDMNVTARGGDIVANRMRTPSDCDQRRLESAARSERAIRLELAACYRIIDMLGWSELIYNHITVRLPGPEDHLLINPYGCSYDEVTASNLVKIDLDGNVVGESEWPVNQAGLIIHTAIHAERHDVNCVMHIHTTAGSAVANLRSGLDPNSFYAAALGDRIAYHDFEGVTVVFDEASRLVKSLGPHDAMILRNHGLLTCGRTIGQALRTMYLLHRACEVQIATFSTGYEGITISPAARARFTQTRGELAAGRLTSAGKDPAELVFAALRRKVDRLDRSYQE